MGKDARTYIRLHDGMPDHPKVDGLSDAAFRSLITLWCWSSRHLTDGRIPAGTWRKHRPKARSELLAAGLAVESTTGVLLHDYLDHQRSADEVAELREKRRLAGSQGGKAKADRLANHLANATDSLEQIASRTLPETEGETEVLETSSSTQLPRKRGSTSNRGTRIDPNWVRSPADVEWQRAERITDEFARAETAAFKDWALSVAGPNGVKKDWSLAWRNWMRRAWREHGGGSPRAVAAAAAASRPAWEA